MNFDTPAIHACSSGNKVQFYWLHCVPQFISESSWGNSFGKHVMSILGVLQFRCVEVNFAENRCFSNS